MKKHMFLLFCIGISLVGCNQEETIKILEQVQAEIPQEEHIEEKPFTVKERQNEEYKSIKEVVKPDEIKTVIELIKNAEWEENIQLEMALPPEYRFSLGSINYTIWVTPKRTRLEIIAEGQSKYIKLPIKESVILYKIITGKEL